METLPTYQPSGKFSRIVFLYFTLFLLFACPVLAYFYAYAEGSKFKLLSFLIVILFPLLQFSVLTVVCLSPAKVRNPGLATTLGIVAGVGVLYCHLCFWPAIKMHLPILETLVSLAFPGLAFHEVFDGGHGLSFFRLGRWIAEAVYILTVTGFGCRVFALRPFSETKNRWLEENDLPPMELVDNNEELTTAFASGHFHQVANPQPASPKQSHSIFTLFHLDGEEFYLSIKNRKLPYPRNYKSLSKFDDTSVLTRVRIDVATGRALKMLLPRR
jgi:hypothetical protein